VVMLSDVKPVNL